MAHERAKKLAKKLAGLAKKKGRKMSAKKAAIEVGYSENYADSGRFKKTEIWPDLLAQHLPKSKLALRHGELLDFASIEHYVFPSTGRGKNKNSKHSIYS